MPKTVVITGASDGIGAATARRLAADGHQVILVGRSPVKTLAIARELDAPCFSADYADLDQVRRLADQLGAIGRIDVLINNAGGIMGERRLTVNGFELTFQVNHLAPFLLTTLLVDRLCASDAVVIQTASIAANLLGSGFRLDDLGGELDYAPRTAYGNAKLANVLFTRELDRRYRAKGISTVAVHPGLVRSNFAAGTTHPIGPVYRTERFRWLVAGDPGSDWEHGGFYANGKPLTLTFSDPNGSVARGLWEESARLVYG
jgi:NAD(P)-dependent dehydrogenase (short-subunit alcohol dehydrogenase family)